MSIGRTKFRRRGILIGCLVICSAALWAPTAQTVPTVDTGRGNGAVYVQTNTAPNNYVMVFNRNHNGTLTAAGQVATGGVGKPAGNPPLGIPFLDTAGSVTLSHNGRFLFVVNAGDNTVSSFRVGPHGLQLADVEPSLGSTAGELDDRRPPALRAQLGNGQREHLGLSHRRARPADTDPGLGPGHQPAERRHAGADPVRCDREPADRHRAIGRRDGPDRYVPGQSRLVSQDPRSRIRRPARDRSGSRSRSATR